MSQNSLTHRQQEAVDRPDNRLVVLAGAGSGKTRVLVERYLRLINEGVSPQHILAATFTERAAAEMKSRVIAELQKQGQFEKIAEINGAPICTLHGFCSRLITPHTLQLGLDPNYVILDDYQSQLHQESVFTKLLARWRSNKPEQLAILVEGLWWADEHRPRPGRASASKGFSRQFLDLMEAVRCAGRIDTTLFGDFEVNPKKNQATAILLLNELDALIGTNSKIPEKSLEKADQLRSLLKIAGVIPGDIPRVPLEVIHSMRTISLQVSAMIKGVFSKAKTELYPALCDEYYAPTYQQIRNILNELFADYYNLYQSHKHTIGVMDFLDLEEIALEILRQYRTSLSIQYALVDEAQDLNFVQWEILDQIGKVASIFAVGDSFQSIYGFRYADVKLFTDFAQKAEQTGNRCIKLPENFRSRATLLNSINTFFTELNADQSTTNFIKLQARLPYPRQETEEIELLVANGVNRQEARQTEARLLASRFLDLKDDINFNVNEPDHLSTLENPSFTSRRPQWKDFLILVRAGSSFQYLEDAFRDAGIPLMVMAGRGFWDAMEISDLLWLLTALENPFDSFSLACVLKSPAVGFNDDDLLALRVENHPPVNEETSAWRQREIYEGLSRIQDKAAPFESLARRSANFLTLFDRLYNLKDRIPLRELLKIWVEKFEIESKFPAGAEGNLARSNVRKFLRLCDENTGITLSQLKRHFDEFRLREMREGLSSEPESGEGAVRAMTVHAAKGLESPIVAIFDTNHGKTKGSGAFSFSRNAGAAFSLLTSENKEGKIDLTIRKAISSEKEADESGEELRVLYVAMTRAREKLMISASASQQRKDSVQRKISVGGWCKLLFEGLKLDPETLFSEGIESTGSVDLVNNLGEKTGWHLHGSTSEVLLKSVKPVVAESELEKQMRVPNGFPAKPLSGIGPLSVVDWIKKEQKRPIRFLQGDFNDWNDELEESSGALLGSWIHRILQLITDQMTDSQIEELAIQQALEISNLPPSNEDLILVSGWCRNFRESELYARIRLSDQIHREFPIIMQLGRSILRGKLDLAFRDKQGWTIVDYKSDRISADKLNERHEIYQRQLQIYALGWRELTGELPVEAIIYYLNLNQQMPASLAPEALEKILVQAS
jgi:ATP-dependent helicase/nuclease subunit A